MLRNTQMGPKFAQQQLNEGFGQLLQDYELLKASGADMNAVLAKMAPSMNDYVAQAVAASASIPEAMRPIIEQMIQQGLLLDANGNAYTSVEQAGITFAQTMDQQFQTLIEKIDAMVNALMGIGNVKIPPVRVPITYDDPGYGGRRNAPEDVPGFAFGSGGIRDFGGGTPAMLHGRERVQTEAQMKAEAAASSADISDASLQKLARVINKGFRDSALKLGATR